MANTPAKTALFYGAMAVTLIGCLWVLIGQFFFWGSPDPAEEEFTTVPIIFCFETDDEDVWYRYWHVEPSKRASLKPYYVKYPHAPDPKCLPQELLPGYTYDYTFTFTEVRGGRAFMYDRFGLWGVEDYACNGTECKIQVVTNTQGWEVIVAHKPGKLSQPLATPLEED